MRTTGELITTRWPARCPDPGPVLKVCPANPSTSKGDMDMTTVEQPGTIDLAKLEQFVFRAVDEVGAALNAALVVIGDKLGLYRNLAGAGPMSPKELAQRSGTNERYVREWLCAQAAGGYLEYEPETGRYSLPAEQAIALTQTDSPAYLPGFFQIALGSVLDSPRSGEAFKSGEGIGWHDHVSDVHYGCERFFRPSYNANLLTSWLPALDGVVEVLERGALVADVGCGHGSSTILMAKAFPNSTFQGSDYHASSIETARARAAEAGVSERVTFEVAPAMAFSGAGFDLVTMFDCLHDMGDPVGAARHVHEALAPGGTWMVVEPQAGDRVEDNLNPIGRAYYGFSTLPSFLAFPGGRASPRCAGRRSTHPRCGDCRRLYPFPARCGNSVQRRVRSTVMRTTTWFADSRPKSVPTALSGQRPGRPVAFSA
jgi:2-polyprenyl-3-methyl-5-hydroxy-6-metoxy-1,4-benzoquinol methylase